MEFLENDRIETFEFEDVFIDLDSEYFLRFGDEFEAFVLEGDANLVIAGTGEKINLVVDAIEENADGQKVGSLFEGKVNVEGLEDVVGDYAEIHKVYEGFWCY